MRWQELMESSSENLFRQYGGKLMKFSQLPISAQKAIDHYMTVDGDRPEYADELLFGYVVIPIEAVKHACWTAPDNDIADYADWDEYHTEYWQGEDESNYKNHLTEMRPVILSDAEGIEDGWHRLHWYHRNGVEQIPAVLIRNK